MAAPEINIATFAQYLSSVCSCGWRPRLLTGFIRLWMTEHFSLEDRIEDCLLKHRIWTADKKTTNILIESATKWKPELTEKRPAVIVKRNTIKILRQIIDDRIMGVGPEGSKLKYLTFLLGSHTIFCIAGEGGEAEVLAAEVYRELIQFAPTLRGPLGFHKLIVTEVGQLGLLEEATENFVVPINLSWAVEDSWEVVPQVPVIESIDISLFGS